MRVNNFEMAMKAHSHKKEQELKEIIPVLSN